MKIDNSVRSVGGTTTPVRQKPQSGVAGATTAQTSDRVELSPLAAQLQGAEGAMASAPAVDAARVAEIKQAIAEGRFQVNPERIASGLIDSVRQMLDSRR